MKSLEEASKKLFKWFNGNLMKSNPDKYIILSNSVIAHLYGYVIVALLTKQKQTKWDMFKNNLWWWAVIIWRITRKR